MNEIGHFQRKMNTSKLCEISDSQGKMYYEDDKCCGVLRSAIWQKMADVSEGLLHPPSGRDYRPDESN
jgi:hypothetical protein